MRWMREMRKALSYAESCLGGSHRQAGQQMHDVLPMRKPLPRTGNNPPWKKSGGAERYRKIFMKVYQIFLHAG